MASGHITSWQIDGETVETVADFICGGGRRSKITASGDCSLGIKTLAPWKKTYDQHRQHIKKQRHYFANKGPSSQGYGVSNVSGASTRNPAHGKSHEEETPQAKASRILREPPWTYSSIYPKTRICLPYYIMPFTNSSDINRGLFPHHLFLEKVNLELLDNKSSGHNKSASIQKPC